MGITQFNGMIHYMGFPGSTSGKKKKKKKKTNKQKNYLPVQEM